MSPQLQAIGNYCTYVRNCVTVVVLTCRKSSWIHPFWKLLVTVRDLMPPQLGSFTCHRSPTTVGAVACASYSSGIPSGSSHLCVCRGQSVFISSFQCSLLWAVSCWVRQLWEKWYHKAPAKHNEQIWCKPVSWFTPCTKLYGLYMYSSWCTILIRKSVVCVRIYMCKCWHACDSLTYNLFWQCCVKFCAAFVVYRFYLLSCLWTLSLIYWGIIIWTTLLNFCTLSGWGRG